MKRNYDGNNAGISLNIAAIVLWIFTSVYTCANELEMEGNGMELLAVNEAFEMECTPVHSGEIREGVSDVAIMPRKKRGRDYRKIKSLDQIGSNDITFRVKTESAVVESERNEANAESNFVTQTPKKEPDWGDFVNEMKIKPETPEWESKPTFRVRNNDADVRSNDDSRSLTISSELNCDEEVSKIVKRRKCENPPLSQLVFCVICGKNWEGWKKFEKHALTQHSEMKMMNCPHCDADFFRRNTMRKHVRYKHENNGLMCKYCGYIAGSPYHLRKHANDCGRKEAAKGDENEIIRRGGKRYRCEHCGDVFFGKRQYEEHGSKEHEGKLLFRCLECGKGYARLASVQDHVRRIHKAENRIRCAYCTRCYYTPGRLQEHEDSCRKQVEKNERMRRQGYPSYHCHTCNRDLFLKWRSFRRHVLRHKEYDFCSVCNDGFNRHTNPHGLTKHMRMKHPLRENIAALLGTIDEAKAIAAKNAEWLAKSTSE